MINIKSVLSICASVLLSSCVMQYKTNISPNTIKYNSQAVFRHYVDSLIMLKTNQNFIVKEGYRVYQMKDTLEKLNICLDTLCFNSSIRFEYLLKQRKKNTLIQNLSNELKSIGEIKTNYYLIWAEVTNICFYNDTKKTLDCHEEITDFTFFDKGLLPVVTYYWWRGSLREKKVYNYEKNILKSVSKVKL